MFLPRSRLVGDGVTSNRIFDTSEALVVLKFGKVTDTLLIYLRNLLAYHDFWSEVSVTSRNKRKIDHYWGVPFVETVAVFLYYVYRIGVSNMCPATLSQPNSLFFASVINKCPLIS